MRQKICAVVSENRRSKTKATALAVGDNIITILLQSIWKDLVGDRVLCTPCGAAAFSSQLTNPSIHRLYTREGIHGSKTEGSCATLWICIQFGAENTLILIHPVREQVVLWDQNQDETSIR
jgi:hypothetical protein